MASAPNNTGNLPLFSRPDAVTIMARALGREMRSQKQTNEKLERLTGLPERRIEALRSFTEESPVYLSDVLSLAAVLGPRFLTSIFSEINMYAAEFSGASPQKVANDAIALLRQIVGDEQ
jgi:hypothetical protein